MFACEHEGVVPDLITTAKGIAGGLPLAAVTGRAELMDAVHAGGLGGTYGGNPVACAAALGVDGRDDGQDLPGRAKNIESLMIPRLTELAEQHPQIGDVRGRGAMLAIEIVEPGTRTAMRRAPAGSPRPATARRPDPDLRDLRQRAALPAAAGHPRCAAGGGAWTCWPKRSTREADRRPRWRRGAGAVRPGRSPGGHDAALLRRQFLRRLRPRRLRPHAGSAP